MSESTCSRHPESRPVLTFRRRLKGFLFTAPCVCAGVFPDGSFVPSGTGLPEQTEVIMYSPLLVHYSALQTQSALLTHINQLEGELMQLRAWQRLGITPEPDDETEPSLVYVQLWDTGEALGWLLYATWSRRTFLLREFRPVRRLTV